jgi:rhodanese-related sulfurtransferase
MNIRISIALFLVVLLIILTVACNTTSVVTTIPTTEQPTEEELDQTSVSYPEIPRITAEELRLIMETRAEGDFILVDVRSEEDWDTTRLRKALNIPNVSNDPLAQQSRMTQLQLLPKDKLIIFYGDSPDDSDAASLAQQLIDLNAGYDSENIKVLWQGHPRWKELRYPTKDTGA